MGMGMGGGGGGGMIGAAGILAGGNVSAQAQMLPLIFGDGPGFSSADQIIVDQIPRTNLALQATQFDALNLLGFGDFGNVPGPIQQLAGDIGALAIGNKMKRRALVALQKFREHTPGEPGGLGGFRKELRGVLGKLGLSISDLDGIVERQSQFDAQRTQQLKAAGALNQNTIQDRQRTASAASALLGSAAGFATSGEPQSDLQRQLLGRLNRNIDDQEEQFLLRAQFGGFQPGAGLEQFQNQRLDVNLTALEQSLAAAAGLTAGLGSGLQLAQGSSAQGIGAAQGSAQIAAQQAMVANQLRSDNRKPSDMEIIQGAGETFGTSLANAGVAASS